MSDFWNRLAVAITAEGRSTSVLVALVGATIFVFSQSSHTRIIPRMGEAATAGLIAWATGPEIAAWSGWSLTVVVICITAFGQIVLASARDLLRDRTILLDLIKAIIGRGK